jgi:hypothetical protein
MHFVKLPVTVILATIWPDIAAFFRDYIIPELATVLGPVLPNEGALTMLLATLILSVINCTVDPSLRTVAVLKVHHPISFILRTVSVDKLSLAVSSILLPAAIVITSVSMNKATNAVSLVVEPVAFKL